MTDWRIDFAEFVRERLPTDSAQRLIGMLRTTVRLSAAAAGERVVGRLGGVPRLPDGVAWPTRFDRALPMSFVAELDCGQLTQFETDIALPADGTLLFFVAAEVEQSVVIYVPDGIAVAERPTPVGAESYSELALAALAEPSWPDLSHPAVVDVFGSIEEARRLVWDHVLDHNTGETFGDDFAIYKQRGEAGPEHQVGGYGDALQNPVETLAAHEAGTGWYGDPDFQREARQWVTLLQVAEDTRAGMIWGDGAYLIWGIRSDRLAERDFSKVRLYVSGH
ncbi:DUF1963 domain-containing protein [Streptosporangiaceae bacterium NEAU-GS5]|nr:DUF1963 domain-containing protein [Streptosporangiaceae bacterium NEAU-GS5]